MHQLFHKPRNYYTGLILKLLAVLILFTICRLLFYAFNHNFFSFSGPQEFLLVFLSGIRFDLVALSIVNAPFIVFSLFPVILREKSWYRAVLSFLYISLNALALLANLIDFVYFPYTLKRTTADVFDFISIGGGGDFLRLLPSYISDFWYLIVIWVIFILILFGLNKRYSVAVAETGNKLIFFLKNTLYLALGLVLGVIASRGGVQLRPIGIISAGESASARNIPLVLNTPFTIIRTIGADQIEYKEYFNDESQLKSIYYPIHQYHSNADSLRKCNVVILILEGFSRESMSYENRCGIADYKGYTPFLDSLATQSLLFDQAYANGKKSIEGIPAILASLPNLMEKPYITSQYGGNSINSIASLLKPYGYHSAFFHGGTNGTMQFDAFASMAGFDQYFGRNEYNNEKDFDGNWGIWDEPFLQYTVQKMSSFKQPFVSCIFTLSSHHPYSIPLQYKGRFSKGKLEIHESIGYADYALNRFFQSVKHTDWFKNTIFVITADHSSATWSEYYSSCLGNLSIPILYYTPNDSLQGIRQTVTQQIDILPSVLDMIRYPKPFFSFGESVFNQNARHFNICYFNNIYQFVYQDLLIQFNGEKVTAVFKYREDPLLKQNLLNDGKTDSRAVENLLKAFLQTYFSRIKNNQLTVKQ
jgi:phosphoglycerol transferase MdoB-like AlkP superfamily enzyme